MVRAHALLNAYGMTGASGRLAQSPAASESQNGCGMYLSPLRMVDKIAWAPQGMSKSVPKRHAHKTAVLETGKTGQNAASLVERAPPFVIAW